MHVIRLLESQPTSSSINVAQELKGKSMNALLEGNLETWRNEVKEALAAKLGYTSFSTPRSNVLHPADRLTARFRCQRCNHFEVNCKKDGCFDFAGACAHQCAKPGSEKTPDEWKLWTSDIFIKDEMASAAIANVLQLCKIDGENSKSLDDWSGVQSRILCRSCSPGSIVMSPAEVVGHSHRHENMELALLTSEEADKILTRPLKSGLSVFLLGKVLKEQIKTYHERKVYGCRHCTQKQENPSQDLFTFNGLRSHIWSSHKIAELRDEDFLCTDKTVLEFHEAYQLTHMV